MIKNFSARSCLLLTTIAASLFLTGCDNLFALKSDKVIKGHYDENKERLEEIKNPGERQSANSSDPLSVSNDVWVGNQAIRMRKGHPLPSKFDQEHGFTLISNAPMNLFSLATQISNGTNIPVRVVDMNLAAASGGSVFGADASASLDSGATSAISYDGPLSTFLDQIASQFDVSWRYDGQGIYLYRYESKTFVVEAMPGKLRVNDEFDTGAGGGGGSGGGGGGGAGGGGGNSAQEMKQTNQNQVDLDYWKDLEATIRGMIGSDGTLNIMQTSGTVTVTARPAKLSQVAQFLDAENNRLSKQIAIDVAVYNVNLRDTDSYGLDLNAVFRDRMFGRDISTISLNPLGSDNRVLPLPDPSGGTQGSISFALFGPGWDANLVPRALSTVGNVSVVTRSPIVTLNNRPASRKISVDRAYAASTTSTVIDGGASQTAITPGTINTGFTLQLLPRMMPDGRILLQYSIRISELLGEPVPFGPTGNQIQLPEVDNKVFVQQAILQNGATLVLSGFERDRNSDSARGIGSATNWLLGGGIANDQNREQLVISITPRDISPERGSTNNP